MDARNHHSFTKRRVHRILLLSKREKERLQQENLLLHKEAELSGLREKEIRQRNKEAELREALFRRISFFHKLPSLHTDDKQDESAANSKIVVTNTEWAEVISVVNDAFDNFVVRLQQAYPSLGEKEIGFCCLVKNQCQYTGFIRHLLYQQSSYHQTKISNQNRQAGNH